MKIVNREIFLAMPAGTLYSKYEHCFFGDLCIKGDTLPNGNDWFYQQLADAVKSDDSGDFSSKLFNSAENGTELEMDFHREGRDGCFDLDQKFAVWSLTDLEHLILRLTEGWRDAVRANEKPKLS